MAEFASNAKANTGVTLGAIGTGLSVLNGGLGNILGGWNNCGCSENMAVNRYELNMQTELSAKDGKIALLESNIYTDQKLNDLRNYVDRRVNHVEDAVNAQAVYNATNTATIGCIQGQIAQLQGLTKLIVPIANVCPQPMPQYNSWTAPTTTTTP